MDEMSKLVAEKVMGWTLEKYIEDDVYISDEWVTDIKSKFNRYMERIDISKFNPSTDIKDAWMVVDKLKKECKFFNLDFQDDSWSCEFGNEYSGQNEVWAETPELAICKAALKLKGIAIKSV